MLRGTIVTLSHFEIQVAKNLVRMIYESNKKGNQRLTGTVDKSRPKEETAYEGFCAELAFCKLANIYPDISIHQEINKVDCTYLGNSIDVKQTPYQDRGHLIIKQTLAVDCNVDLFVLMTGTCPEFTYKGWAYREELIQRENITDMGYANDKPYALQQYQLHGYKIPEKNADVPT